MRTPWSAFLFPLLWLSANCQDLSSRLVVAVNCGGPRAYGAYGVLYGEDALHQGQTSDYGSRYEFINADEDDRAIYQTERYSDEDFTYSFNMVEQGKYTLMLKFSEVYFETVGSKVFDVRLNDILIITDLDILKETLRPGFAYERRIEFSVADGKLVIGSVVKPAPQKLTVTFVKGKADNPKVNAIAIFRASAMSLPPPPPMPVFKPQEEIVRRRQIPDHHEDDIMDDDDSVLDSSDGVTTAYDDEESESVVSGRPHKNPYEQGDNLVIIVVSVLVIIIPLVHLLRKL